MNTENLTTQERELWELAKQRAGFKWHLVSYILVNSFLVALWFISDTDYFWPIWTILGWGIGLLMNYLAVYHSNNFFSVEKEYKKLKENEQK